MSCQCLASYSEFSSPLFCKGRTAAVNRDAPFPDAPLGLHSAGEGVEGLRIPFLRHFDSSELLSHGLNAGYEAQVPPGSLRAVSSPQPPGTGCFAYQGSQGLGFRLQALDFAGGLVELGPEALHQLLLLGPHRSCRLRLLLGEECAWSEPAPRTAGPSQQRGR